MGFRNRFCIGLLCALAAACATPEVAETYEEKTLVPQEIESALGSDDPTRRAEALKQVEVMDPAQSKAVLMELTGHEAAAVRITAVNGLAKHHAKDADVVAKLAEVLSLDPDTDVRINTIHALAGIGSVDGLQAIVDALGNDTSLVVKREAALVLDKLTGKAKATQFVSAVEEAEMAGDDATMFYEEWFEDNRAALKWDASRSRFLGGR